MPQEAAAAVTDHWAETTFRTATWCFDMLRTVTHVATHLVSVGPHLPSNGWLAGDGDRVAIVSGQEVDWSADGITWHRGTSTADLPEDSGVSTGPDNSWVVGPSVQCWLVGSLIVAFTTDMSTLYVGHVGG